MPERTLDNPPTSMCADVRQLAELRPGDSGRVVSVDAELGVRQRLLEMGLTPGTAVRLIRLAPLGDPMELAVRGYRLSVRRSEARLVRVARDGTESAAGGASSAGGR